jgi:hypothetical protein
MHDRPARIILSFCHLCWSIVFYLSMTVSRKLESTVLMSNSRWDTCVRRIGISPVLISIAHTVIHRAAWTNKLVKLLAGARGLPNKDRHCSLSKTLVTSKHIATLPIRSWWSWDGPSQFLSDNIDATLANDRLLTDYLYHILYIISLR